LKKSYWIVAALALLLPRGAHAQTSADSAAVLRAGLDYIEGFYNGDADMLKRSVRPNVTKFGFSRGRDAATFSGDTMSYAQFMSYAERVKKRGGTTGPAAAIKNVQIMDIMNQIAAVKVTAWWGTDYLHLGKYDGQWMISHVIWQSPPAAASK
jgi:hypothetical protein